jgi:hypothetical protein
MYYIVEKLWGEVQDDALEDMHYVGEASVFIFNVPHAVTEQALRLWMDTGLNEHTEQYAQEKNTRAALQEELRTTEETLDALMRSAEDLDVVRDKGRRLEFEIRELKRGIDGCNAALARIERKLATGPANLDSSMYSLQRLPEEDDAKWKPSRRRNESKIVEKTGMWQATFVDRHQGQKLAYFAAHMEDWRNFKLGFHPETGVPYRCHRLPPCPHWQAH